MQIHEPAQLEFHVTINEDIHFQELKRKIRGIQHECAPKGWIGGPYLQMLCDTLLDDLEIYIIKLYDTFLNKVKIENLYKSISSDAVSNFIDINGQNILEKYSEIIQHESTITTNTSNLVKSLSFNDKFNDKLKKLAIEFKAKFAEHKRQIINEETRLETEKASLKMATEANKIAASSKTASWIMGIISNLIALAAFIVAYLAFKK